MAMQGTGDRSLYSQTMVINNQSQFNSAAGHAHLDDQQYSPSAAITNPEQRINQRVTSYSVSVPRK